MRSTFYTPQGMENRELTSEELQKAAESGSTQARRELMIERLRISATDRQKIDILSEFLELKETA